jgi:uncharacterized membrane protein
MNTTPELKGIQKLSALQILLVSLFIGFLSYIGSLFINMNTLTHIMMGWDVFCLVLITLHWYMFFHTSASETHLKAKMQDETRGEIFAIVLVSTFAGLLAVILLLINKDIKTNRPDCSNIWYVFVMVFSSHHFQYALCPSFLWRSS